MNRLQFFKTVFMAIFGGLFCRSAKAGVELPSGHVLSTVRNLDGAPFPSDWVITTRLEHKKWGLFKLATYCPKEWDRPHDKDAFFLDSHLKSIRRGFVHETQKRK